MKPDIKFQTGTVGPHNLLAYIININNGWYTNAYLITANTRNQLRTNKCLRKKFKDNLERKFWRYIGAG